MGSHRESAPDVIARLPINMEKRGMESNDSVVFCVAGNLVMEQGLNSSKDPCAPNAGKECMCTGKIPDG
jgi:hypothetical protein